MLSVEVLHRKNKPIKCQHVRAKSPCHYSGTCRNQNSNQTAGTGCQEQHVNHLKMKKAKHSISVRLKCELRTFCPKKKQWLSAWILKKTVARHSVHFDLNGVLNTEALVQQSHEVVPDTGQPKTSCTKGAHTVENILHGIDSTRCWKHSLT